jgi:hypothetical protein
MQESPSFSVSLPELGFVFLVYNNHHGMNWYSLVVLICISLIANVVGYLFMGLFTILIFFLVNLSPLFF